MDQTLVTTLINSSRDIAQLNLGYLGISVAILGALVYFNIKPLKETLDKQEKKIEDLKIEANDLLDKSKGQSEKTLEEFKLSQTDLVASILKQQKNEIELETKNKIQESQNSLSDKIENISENKDVKLKEIILSETNNNLTVLDKDLNSKINTTKEEVLKEVKSFDSGLKARIKELDEKIKELMVYKFSKEGQMGAIIYSIELLGDAIEDYFKLKEILKGISFDAEKFGWKVKYRLKGLIAEIGELALEQEYILKINLLITKIENEVAFSILIDELKKKLTP